MQINILRKLAKYIFFAMFIEAYFIADYLIINYYLDRVQLIFE